LRQLVDDSALSVDSTSSQLQAGISALPLNALLVSFTVSVASALELGAATTGFSTKAVRTETNSPVLGHLADCVLAAGSLALIARTLALAVDAGAVVGAVVVVAAAESANSVLAELSLRTALIVAAFRAALAILGACFTAVTILGARATLGAESIITG
jgi:hypothetical protein